MYTPIKLDKTRNLKFGMRAFYLIEDRLKIKMSQIDYENIGMKELAVIIWAGLFHEDKELTIDKTIDLIDEHTNLIELMNVMQEAMSKSFNLDNTASKGQGESEKNK